LYIWEKPALAIESNINNNFYMYIIEKKSSWYNRLNSEIYYFFIINVTIFIIDNKFFINHYYLIEVCIFLIVLLQLSRNNSKIIYKLRFDNVNKTLRLYYYKFLFVDSAIDITYANLRYKYFLKSYGVGNVMMTLVFMDQKKNIAEIREKNEIGWTKNEVLKIIDKLNDAKQMAPPTSSSFATRK
jgi:hypothetical protein